MKKGSAVFLRKSDAKLGLLWRVISDDSLWFVIPGKGNKATADKFHKDEYTYLGSL